MRHFFIILLLFCVTKTFAGDDSFSNLTKYLPEQITANPSYLKTEKQKIEFYSKINPNLIYIYIEHLNRKLTKHISDPDSNFHSYFGYLLNKSKEAKHKWANQNILDIHARKILPLAKERIKSYFYGPTELDFRLNATQNEKLQPPADLDKNMQAYFVYLTLKEGKAKEYSPEKNYQKLCKDELVKIAKFFEEKYQQLEVIGKRQRDKLIRQALFYSYIFKNSYLPEFENTDFSLADFITKSVVIEYQNHFEFYVGYAFEPFSFKFKNIITFKDLYDQKFNYSMDVQNNHYLQLGIKIPFNKDIVPFSFINLKAGFAISSNVLYDETVDIGHIIRYDNIIYVNGTYKLVNFRDFNTYSLQGQVTIPLFFVSKNLYLETGVDYKSYYLSFKYDYYFDGYVIDHATGEIPDFYKGWSDSIKKQNIRIKPMLSANYTLFDFINLKVEFFIPNDVQVAGYIFKSF